MFTLVLALSSTACRPGDVVEQLGQAGPSSDDDGAAVYDPEHLVRVEIELDAADWEALRSQARDSDVLVGDDCLDEPFANPYTWFGADVTLDGETFEGVAVRKKAFLGSASYDKPGLKIDLLEYGGTALFDGLERLTLNNSVSDPSYVRQCLGYGFYRDAGLPASRCNFAHVWVNDEDLGVYVNVEPVKKDLLRRYFDDDSGNLYEGTLSDFREGWTGTFEKKTNEELDDWSDIDAAVAAVQADDDVLLDTLDPVFDLDSFLTFWAAEVISLHSDGYTWNTNNFYLYGDPSTGRFHFIPWGIDGALYNDGGNANTTSVFAYGSLAWRLYMHPDGRQLYLDRLQQVLETSWDGEVLVARIDQMEAIVLPELDEDEDEAVGAEVDAVRDIVRDRERHILQTLERGDPEWTDEPRDSYCIEFIGELSASFETTWGTVDVEDPFTYGGGDLTFSYYTDSWSYTDFGAVAGYSGGAPVLLLAKWVSGSQALLVYYTSDAGYFAPGTVALDWNEAVAALYYFDANTMTDFEMVGYIMGEASFDQAGVQDGDPVTGSMYGSLMTWGM